MFIQLDIDVGTSLNEVSLPYILSPKGDVLFNYHEFGWKQKAQS